jgi:hypothetical protein
MQLEKDVSLKEVKERFGLVGTDLIKLYFNIIC